MNISILRAAEELVARTLGRLGRGGRRVFRFSIVSVVIWIAAASAIMWVDKPAPRSFAPAECSEAKTAGECADILRHIPGKNPSDAFDADYVYPPPSADLSYWELWIAVALLPAVILLAAAAVLRWVFKRFHPRQ